MSIGVWQVLLILVIVLIIFGAGKLPQVMGDVAKGVRSFKAGLKDALESQRIVWVEGTHLPQSISLSPSAKDLELP